ncbi:hypothetical protein A9Q99_27710 [Gammaproteobacteria bacterium 45_16_T64]|nr:hypothetical protein A9Q99_27710 [Gammaproteobacteria bacterium 45_16_T64]
MSTYLFSYLQQTRQLSDKSISRDITVLDSFYNWAYKKGFAVSRPTFSFTYEKKNRRNRQGGSSAHSIKRMHKEYIDQESFEFLLENVTNKNPFINERNCLTLELGYKLGLRAAEVTHPKNLNTTKLRNLIENEPTGSSIEIDIFGKRNKWRTVIVPPDLVDNIDRFLNKRRKYYPDGPLICSTKGKILSASFASKVFRKCRIHTNSEEWKDRRFHSLRKSFATNLVAWCYLHGIDPWQMVPERMGHESSETTKIYVFFDAVYNMRTDVIRTLSLENYSFNFNKKRLRKNEKK